MRVIAFIDQGDVATRILEHLGLPAQAPAAWPARAPPLPLSRSDAEVMFDAGSATWIDADPGTDPGASYPDPAPEPDPEPDWIE